VSKQFSPPPPSMTGRLYVVSLPIGNLSDITLRAIETLREVDYILAEDTRTTKRVLDRYEIRTPFFSSLYEGAEDGRVRSVVDLLLSGKTVALVSDAGTPLISDPGFPLVRAAVAAGVPVCPVPGPIAAIAALVASALPADRFLFEGSLPRKRSHRMEWFAQLQRERRTTIMYESPHRLQETLDLLAHELPERTIVVAREITKLHEEFLRGIPADVARTLAERGEVRGECVLLIEGAEGGSDTVDPRKVEALLALARDEGLSKKAIEKLLVVALGMPKNRAYELAHRASV
jgi:16S rRNA (cytidine1402-2'-O)-methyltransferase